MTRILFFALALLLLTSCSENNDASIQLSESSPLVVAAEENRIEDVKSLLNNGHNVNAMDDCGWTALMKASLYGHLEISELLIQHGATIDQVDSGGYTAMLLAASNNHKPVVRALLDKGAAINHQEQTRGWTALIWASKRGHAETVRLLLTRNADRHITDHSVKTALSWAQQSNEPAVVMLLE